MNNILDPYNHEYFMRQALTEAKYAFDEDEVPIGAVIVYKNKIIARAHNLTERLTDPTAHAEMQALTSATNAVGGKYLNECTIYVTVEPCPMCAAACFWTQVGTIVYGADDEKRGYTRISEKIIHPKTKIIKGVMAKESAQIMTDFFEKKRKKY